MVDSMRDAVLEALRGVQDPDLKKDLVTLNMIQNLEVGTDGRVSLHVVLTTPACPLKEKIEKDVRQAVQAVPGVREVRVQMTANVRGSQSRAGARTTGAIP